MKHFIWIAEPEDYSPKALEFYRGLGNVHEASEQENVRKEHPDFKATTILVVRLKYTIDSSWLKNMPDLKIIATPTTGYNHLDLEEIKKRKIKIISLRGHTSFLEKITSTAELALGLLLVLVRRIPASFDDVKAGKWNRDKFKGHQLAGKTLGILGLGRLGKIMASYGKALGMKVIATDPHISESEMSSAGATKVSIEDLFKQADVVSIHVLLTEETKGLVQESHLRMMKESAYLINTARAEIIAENALEKALEEKWIAGAGVDVMWGEQGGSRFESNVLENSRLLKYARNQVNKGKDNIIIVPHTGGATYEAMQVTEEFIADLVSKEVK